MARRAPARPETLLGDWNVSEILPPYQTFQVALYQSGRWTCTCQPGQTFCAHIRRVRGVQDQETVKFTLNGKRFQPQIQPSDNNNQPVSKPRRTISFED